MTLQDLAKSWREKAREVDGYHATMGTGWHVCADELDSALAETGWQPIETAPKDGENVLLWCKHRGVVRGHWDENIYAKRPKPYWTHDRERLYGVAETRRDQPTYWQPLPSPPDLTGRVKGLRER
jgi:hypothetical protein